MPDRCIALQLLPAAFSILCGAEPGSDIERVLPSFKWHFGRRIECHDLKSVLRGNLAPDHLIRVFGLLNLSQILVGDDDEIATEDGSIKLQSKASLAVEVEVRHDLNAH